MAKRVTITETVPENEKKWRGATFFTSTGDDESKAEKKIEKLVKKYLTGKNHVKEVKDV